MSTQAGSSMLKVYLFCPLLTLFCIIVDNIAAMPKPPPDSRPTVTNPSVASREKTNRHALARPTPMRSEHNIVNLKSAPIRNDSASSRRRDAECHQRDAALHNKLKYVSSTCLGVVGAAATGCSLLVSADGFKHGNAFSTYGMGGMAYVSAYASIKAAKTAYRYHSQKESESRSAVQSSTNGHGA